ncbi:MAG: hypothetical protein ACXWJW_15190 [Xanthobacteraceae bacterium]
MDKPTAGAQPAQQPRLREAVRQARIESAERSAVIFELHDAEIARLEILNEALDPLYEEIPRNFEQFDRGITRGEPPRLWIDMVAHVDMGRDRRTYRFIQDTQNGPVVLNESTSADEIAQSVTKYVARRMVERDRAFATHDRTALWYARRRWTSWSGIGMFLFGLVLGIAVVLAIALIAVMRY